MVGLSECNFLPQSQLDLADVKGCNFEMLSDLR
jgi:hypothetical protein